MNTQQAIDTATWIATHRPLLQLSVMITEWLANQMMSRSSQSWLANFVGWNTDVNISDIAREAYQYEMDLLFGNRHAPPVDNVIGVLNQVNSIVSGVKLPTLPNGINIASVLGTLNGSASRLAALPETLADDEIDLIRKVIDKARKNKSSSLADADLESLTPNSKEWVRLGFSDLMSSSSKDSIAHVYSKWRKWGQTHQHTVWEALTAGSLSDSKHWGKLPGKMEPMSEGENHVLDFLRTALNSIKNEFNVGKRGIGAFIEKSKELAQQKQQTLPTKSQADTQPKQQTTTASKKQSKPTA